MYRGQPIYKMYIKRNETPNGKMRIVTEDFFVCKNK